MIKAQSAIVPIKCPNFRVNCQRLISTPEWEEILIKSFNAKILLEEGFKKTVNFTTRNNTEGKKP